MKKSLFLALIFTAALFGQTKEKMPSLFICFPSDIDNYFAEDGILIKEDSGDSLDCLEVWSIAFADFAEDVHGFYIRASGGGIYGDSPNVVFLIDENKNPKPINVFWNNSDGGASGMWYHMLDYFFHTNKNGFLEITSQEEGNDIDDNEKNRVYIFKDGKFVEEVKEKDE
ncbi:hypothetical protein DRQ36_10115 [bacterium]|nr:MAG: hypothetical protein DRQ36_10115 [bacterium]